MFPHCFSLPICGGPCHLSSFKKCSGGLNTSLHYHLTNLVNITIRDQSSHPALGNMCTKLSNSNSSNAQINIILDDLINTGSVMNPCLI